MFGDQVTSIAMPLAAVLVLHAGAADMGYLSALEWLRSLLFALPAGAWVDRRGRRRTTMITAERRVPLAAAVPAAAVPHAGQHRRAGARVGAALTSDRTYIL